LLNQSPRKVFEPHDAYYESPIEEFFGLNLGKYIADHVVVKTQADVRTEWGSFRLDFLVSADGENIGIECDGKQFHDRVRDECRDALILGSSPVRRIYRFRGSDIVYFSAEILYLLSKWEPWIFSERGRVNLEVLASPEAKELEDQNDETVFLNFSEDGERRTIVIERHGRPRGDFWAFAQTRKHKRFNELFALWDAKRFDQSADKTDIDKLLDDLGQ